MNRAARLGWLGGTFDPVHYGHLVAAAAASRALALDQLRFVPSGRPPHRPDRPRASEYHRLEMLRLAVAEFDARPAPTAWSVSDVELRRHGLSFTIDSLEALHREGLSALQIFFIIGADAFAEIATWHRYPAVLDTAHFAVVARPGITLDSLRDRLPALAARMVVPDDCAFDTRPRIILLSVATPDVSSTEIRRRVANLQPIDALVPPAVAAYIQQHALYADSRTAPPTKGHGAH